MFGPRFPFYHLLDSRNCGPAYLTRLLLLGTLALGWQPGALRAQGQISPPASAAVSGEVKDAATRQAVPGATVQLVHMPDTAIVTDTQTDAAGRYEFQGLPAGRYEVRARAMGLKPAASAAFSLVAQQALLTPPPLLLRATPQQIEEVTVVGEKKILEAEAYRLVFNIDQKVSAAGISAYEVLQRTPGVSITQDETLRLGRYHGPHARHAGHVVFGGLHLEAGNGRGHPGAGATGQARARCPHQYLPKVVAAGRERLHPPAPREPAPAA